MEQPGTYFYHVHYGMQRSEGLYGSLIVHIADGKKEPFRYDDELNLLLSDWWHKSSHEQEYVCLLINGRGPNLSVYQLANASSKEMNNAHPRSWNKTYRLRIASTTALASLHLAIEDHNVTEVEGDGNYVQPNQTLSKYWISIGVRRRESKTRQALAILNYSESKTSLNVSHLKHLNGTIMIVARHSLKAYLPSKAKIISQNPRPITVGSSFLTPKTKSMDSSSGLSIIHSLLGLP
ncbi:hypothetical protein PVK06_028933 [Gossypium arboreum]|uniref:L-ascorbate oxidase n=1 Tax=Gossypium arboreum TaxID=29729 RepID=A0ABR0P5A4_GOSAR|nr:hypothetical protein PVK06_028933 [Gossypium arboreum]